MKVTLPRLFAPFSAAILLALLLTSCGGGGREAPPALSEEERMAMPPNLASGERLFLACAVCHERVEGARHRIGPNLWNVYGAPAAQHKDFTYSAALRRSDLTWDAATLDAYIRKPQEIVPGGRMAYEGMDSEADRRDLVAWLKTLTDEPTGDTPRSGE